MTVTSTDVEGRWRYDWSERERWLELDFPMGEYERRLRGVREGMERLGVAALIVYGGLGCESNIRYLSGWNPWFGDTFMLVPRDGESVIVTSGIFHGEPMHSNAQKTWVKDFRPLMALGTTGTPRSPAEGAAAVLREWDLEQGRVGYVDSRRIPAWLDRDLRSRLTHAELVDAGGVLTAMRRIKSPAEIEIIRQLADATSAGMVRGLEAAVPGASEHDVAAAVHQGIIAAGADQVPFGILTQSGPRSAMKNIWPLRGKRIREGEIVSIDANAKLAGYQSDHARSTVAGAAGDDEKRMLEACLEAHGAGLQAAGPGVPINEVLFAMNRRTKELGFEAWDWSTAHGFGMDLLEDPVFYPQNTTPLEAGQCFYLEPMIVPTGVGCVCHEDMVFVTENGAEQLTTSPLRTW
jgi:Xaa-Pro aminopeptidase